MNLVREQIYEVLWGTEEDDLSYSVYNNVSKGIKMKVLVSFTFQVLNHVIGEVNEKR